MKHFRAALAAAALCALPIATAVAEEVGQIKVSRGSVAVERGGRSIAGTVGLRLEAADVVKTGADGTAGITMSDNSLLSVGPNSILALERFDYEPTTSEGPGQERLATEFLAALRDSFARSRFR